MKNKRVKVFDGRLLQVFRSTKILPNGIQGVFEEIDHPGAALLVPFLDERIVFIRQYRAVIGKYIWELPAGTLAKGETPYACARREIKEETGFIVRGVRKIGEVYTTPGFCNEKIHIFRADCVKEEGSARDHDEIIKVSLLSRADVLSKFKKGLINDSKTISALAFAGLLK
ncbi:MAG: NUDIX hydrolase [Candidatus Omnitrophota bacterium]